MEMCIKYENYNVRVMICKQFLHRQNVFDLIVVL